MPTILRNVEIGGQRRDITDDDIKKLIASDSKLMVQVAESFGKHIARDVSSSHIRNIYGTVKQMEMSGFTYHELILLKPKIAYAAKRDGHRAAEELRDVLTTAIEAVGEDAGRFQRFADFFEAILAYHKAHGGR
ncbi:MAG: type III-A CRISPR-associated protein Csm2 [Candidatus Binatia bacterium]